MQAWVANNRSTRLQAFILHVVQQRFKAAGLRCRAPGFGFMAPDMKLLGFGAHTRTIQAVGVVQLGLGFGAARVWFASMSSSSSAAMQGGLQDIQASVWDLGLKTRGVDVTVHPNGCGLWSETTEHYRWVMNVPCPSRTDHPWTKVTLFFCLCQ